MHRKVQRCKEHSDYPVTIESPLNRPILEEVTQMVKRRNNYTE